MKKYSTRRLECQLQKVRDLTYRGQRHARNDLINAGFSGQQAIFRKGDTSTTHLTMARTVSYAPTTNIAARPKQTLSLA